MLSINLLYHRVKIISICCPRFEIAKIIIIVLSFNIIFRYAILASSKAL